MLPLTLEDLWKEAGFIPNEDQEKAIRHIDGPLYLPAGPGSGKTRVLLWRTLNLIVFYGVKPEEIFLSTFTEKAALQLKEGIRALLGNVTEKTLQPYDTSRMYVGTVHSLCRRIITDRFPSQRQRHRAPLLLDEIGQYLYFHKRARWEALTAPAAPDANERITNYLSDKSKSKHSAITALTTFVNRLSEEVMTPEAVRPLAAGDPELLILIDIYQNYLNSMREPLPSGTTDFSLLQQRAFHRLLSFENGGNLFKHVIIDEYQDTNTIQERIFFALARGHKNLCVVGDDDQALYRFRGATVENFVHFCDRCERELGISPTTVPLNKNYRSRPPIVAFYNTFMKSGDWGRDANKSGPALYRVGKTVDAQRADDGPAVVASRPSKPDAVCPEIAELVSELIRSGKVEDPNQIAFLFPSLKSKSVKVMIDALEAKGLKVYAPRAGTFLEVPEAMGMFSVFLKIFGRPTKGDFGGADYTKYHRWLDALETRGAELLEANPHLKQYVSDRREEIRLAVRDYGILLQVVQSKLWDLNAEYSIETMKRTLVSATGLSKRAYDNLASRYSDRIVRERKERFEQHLSEDKPFTLNYMLRRATSMDWSLLDLFYQIGGFPHFSAMFEQAERVRDEGPISNLGLISQYLARFMEQYTPTVTADILADDLLQRLLFGSYLYALYRRGESQYEDAEDPFPRGRIPFITVHQSKGLEFPVVVLGNAIWREHGVRRIEEIVRPLTGREGEPLDRMDGFDQMRMFYVALSRAKDLLVIADYKGRGYRADGPIQSLLEDHITRIPDFDVASLPPPRPPDKDVPKSYSYTSDYLFYNRCPRQYMIFKKYGFTESRSQTMLFGSLVHQTLEDLHQQLIARREHNG